MKPGTITDLWACADCIMFIANGEMEGAGEHWDPDNIDKNWPDHHVVPDGPHEDEDEEADQMAFSWSSCDCCGSRLGGSRHRVAALPKG